MVFGMGGVVIVFSYLVVKQMNIPVSCRYFIHRFSNLVHIRVKAGNG